MGPQIRKKGYEPFNLFYQSWGTQNFNQNCFKKRLKYLPWKVPWHFIKNSLRTRRQRGIEFLFFNFMIPDEFSKYFLWKIFYDLYTNFTNVSFFKIANWAISLALEKIKLKMAKKSGFGKKLLEFKLYIGYFNH